MKKRIVSMLAAITMLAGLMLSGCSGPGGSANTPNETAGQGGNEPTSEETVVLKLGHSLSETLVAHQAMQEFADKVAERTDGAVRIDVYANSQLGGERDMVEGMQLGTVDIAYVSTSVLANFVPDFYMFDAPFLLNSDNIWEVCDGEIGDELGQQLSDTQNIKLLGFMDVGSRNVFSTKPITKLEDFKGIKIRVMENEAQIALFNMLGAQATPMAFSELYTALQQGTVDAGENSLQGITGSGFDEICKYITMTEHIYAVNAFCMSNASLEKIPEEYRDIFLEEAAACIANERELVGAENEKAVDDMKANGCEIYEIPREDLTNAVADIYEQFKDTFPADLVEKVQNME